MMIFFPPSNQETRKCKTGFEPYEVIEAVMPTIELKMKSCCKRISTKSQRPACDEHYFCWKKSDCKKRHTNDEVSFFRLGKEPKTKFCWKGRNCSCNFAHSQNEFFCRDCKLRGHYFKTECPALKLRAA